MPRIRSRVKDVNVLHTHGHSLAQAARGDSATFAGSRLIRQLGIARPGWRGIRRGHADKSKHLGLIALNK